MAYCYTQCWLCWSFFRECGNPINVLTGLDYWLDNLMCNVPEVAMCYHLDGIVQVSCLRKIWFLMGRARQDNIWLRSCNMTAEKLQHLTVLFAIGCRQQGCMVVWWKLVNYHIGVSMSSQVVQSAGAYSSFHGMKCLGVFLSPPPPSPAGWAANPSREALRA